MPCFAEARPQEQAERVDSIPEPLAETKSSKSEPRQCVQGALPRQIRERGRHENLPSLAIHFPWLSEIAAQIEPG
jgi:hypothetical protein